MTEDESHDQPDKTADRRRPAHEDDLHVHDYEDAIIPTFETKFGAGCGIISMLVETGAPRQEIVANIRTILSEWHTAMARLPEDLLVRVEALTELYDDLSSMTEEPSDDARARIAAELARLTLEGPEEYT